MLSTLDNANRLVRLGIGIGGVTKRHANVMLKSWVSLADLCVYALTITLDTGTSSLQDSLFKSLHSWYNNSVCSVTSCFGVRSLTLGISWTE